MAFYDRTIELLILSHPQLDHLTGLIEVVKRYDVRAVIDFAGQSEAEIYKIWQTELKNRKIFVSRAEKGQRIKTSDNFYLDILWPDDIVINGKAQIDINNLSTVVLLGHGKISALFTGDIDKDVLRQIIKQSSSRFDKPLSVLKIPHHGAKQGLDEEILEILKPKITVISVGKNSYSHPSGEIINMLKEKMISVYSTYNNEVVIKL